jgi:transposase
MLINATVVDAARTLGGSEETIDGLLDRGIERAVDGDAWERLGVIGLDAIARKRGHRDVVAVVTGPLEAGGVEVVAGRADRKQQTVVACLRVIPATRRRPIERACTAMDEGFVNAITAARPWAEIVIDRFHVARASRACADTVRKKDLKRRTRALSKAAYAELTGAMWPFRQQPEDRKPEERARLERGFRSSPKIEAAYHRREDLTDLCARDATKAGAKRAIRVWCTRVRESGLSEFERVLGTLDRWMEAITHDGQGRQTSGCVEGCNNRVQGLKRRGYGIVNVGSLFQRLTLDGHGDQLFGHT